mmetsp:Transcript_54673/g.98207  ORF Transcript_54673/g.98207 Transcript_54673/m.98207 type:complete len:262 (-) Transcript_54673:143-928(-)
MADALGGSAETNADSTSVYRDRVARLTDKLSVLHEGLDQDRNTRFDHLQGKMKQLDERLSVSQDAAAKKFGILKEQMLIFQEDLKNERMHRENLAETKEQEINRVDTNLKSILQSEQDSRRETEEKILKTFEEKTAQLKDEINQSGRVRMDNEATLRRFLEVDIPKLYEGLKEEVQNRETMEQRMLKRAMDEVTQLQGAILAEKKAREDTEEAMLRMMEDVVAKMQAEIQTERRERERTEEMLLSLLNDTCHKLQVASQSL